MAPDNGQVLFLRAESSRLIKGVGKWRPACKFHIANKYQAKARCFYYAQNLRSGEDAFFKRLTGVTPVSDLKECIVHGDDADCDVLFKFEYQK